MKFFIFHTLILSTVTIQAETVDSGWLTIDRNIQSGIALGTTEAQAPELSLDLRSGNISAGSMNFGYNVSDAITLNSIGTFMIESAGASAAEWRWQVAEIGGSNLKNQMNLGKDGKLTVFGDEGRSVVIDPNAASVQVFAQGGLTHSLITQDAAGNVSIGGNLRVSGNNVITQPASVSTASLALLGATTTSTQTVAIGLGANAAGLFPTLALGNASYANNIGSIAIGRNTIADGGYTIAIGGFASSKGSASVAIGSSSKANGPAVIPAGSVHNGVAIGVGAGAEGVSSVAFGNGMPKARGFQSISIGRATEANGANQTVLGRCNEVFPAIPEADTTTFNDASVTFVLGNGYHTLNGPTVRQNAMTVRRDNGAAIGTGVSSGGAAQVVVGAYNATPTAATPETGAAFVVGSGYQKDAAGNRLPLTQYAANNQTIRQNALVVRWNGDVEATGALTATGVSTGEAGVSVPGAFKAGNGVVLVAEQGDISMGEFRSGAQP